MSTSQLPPREALSDFTPMVERAVTVDAGAMVRFRSSSSAARSGPKPQATADRIAGFVRLPYDVLAGRTVSSLPMHDFDVTVSAVDFLAWIDVGAGEPARRDAHWLSPLPPRAGWRRLETVPDEAIRSVIRSGAMLARDAGTRAAQESLLSSVVLTATGAGPAGVVAETVDVPLGPLSALTKMGFLPRASAAAIDVAPGWIRVAATFGSTYAAAGNNPLGALGLQIG